MNAQNAPTRFGRYVLLDKMGAGGMAEVYRAVVPGAEGFRRDLVVKRILSDRARAANFIEMFVHEARISALLHHPNVVQVFDFGQVDGSYFLAMELLRGRDLLAIFRSLRERKQSLPIPIAVHVAHQVALGLGYAHALTSPDGQPLNIIHRDVSPSNIMLLRTGGVKLLDFGIAQAIGEMDSEESERSSFKGKLCYMAPERLRDEPQDGRVDLFALGAVLWEMLAGRRLFHGKTDVDKLRSVLDRPIPPPSSIRPEVPPELDHIVLKALARNPDDRYATGQSLADDLEMMVSETKYHSRMMPALLNELFGSAPSSAHLALSRIAPELMAFEPTTTPSLTPALTPETARAAGSSASVDVVDGGGQPHRSLTPNRAAGTNVFQQLRALGRRTKLILAAGLLVWAGILAMVVNPPEPVDTRAARARFPARDQSAAPAPAKTLGRTDSTIGLNARAEGQLALMPDKAEAAEAAAVVAAAGVKAGAPVVAPLPSNSAGNNTAARAPARRAATRPRAAAVKAPARLGAGRITRGLSIDPFAEAAVREPKR